MNPTPEQLRLCAYLMENPEVPWEANHDACAEWDVYHALTPFEVLQGKNVTLRIKPEFLSDLNTKYSREGKRLLILHNHDCDQFGNITGESLSHLWFTRHGGYFKLSLESGEVETLKPAEF